MVVFIRIPSWIEQRRAHPENVMAPLDIGYAMSVLAARGVEARLIDMEAHGHSMEQALALLRGYGPSHLVLHFITSAADPAWKMAATARQRIPTLRSVIAVGQHATVLPETLLSSGSPFDACVRGEFELKLAELVTGETASPEGIATRDGGGLRVDPTVLCVEDLDALPAPDHALFRDGAYHVFNPTGLRRKWRWGFVLSSRGCPFDCIYCSPTLRNSYGRKHRYRSTANLMEELRRHKALGNTIIQFKDDVFTLHRGRVLELCQAMLDARLDLAWTVQTRAEAVDPELLELMARAGCRFIGYGVESGSPRVLATLKKQCSVGQIRDAFRWTARAGIRTGGFFMIGNPDETEGDIRMTHHLMEELRPDMIQVAFFTPYPGAAVFQDGLLDEHGYGDFSHYNAPINFSRVETADLRRWQRRFYLDFILHTGFVGRYLGGELVPILLNPDKFLRLARLSAGFLLGR